MKSGRVRNPNRQRYPDPRERGSLGQGPSSCPQSGSTATRSKSGGQEKLKSSWKVVEPRREVQGPRTLGEWLKQVKRAKNLKKCTHNTADRCNPRPKVSVNERSKWNEGATVELERAGQKRRRRRTRDASNETRERRHKACWSRNAWGLRQEQLRTKGPSRWIWVTGRQSTPRGSAAPRVILEAVRLPRR